MSHTDTYDDDVDGLPARAMRKGEAPADIAHVVVMTLRNGDKDDDPAAAAKCLEERYTGRYPVKVCDYDSLELAAAGKAVTGGVLLFIVGHGARGGLEVARQISAGDLVEKIGEMGILPRLRLVSLIICNAGSFEEEGFAAKVCDALKAKKATPYVSARKSNVFVGDDGHIWTFQPDGKSGSGPRVVKDILKYNKNDKGIFAEMWKHDSSAKTVLRYDQDGQMRSITGFTTRRGSLTGMAGGPPLVDFSGAPARTIAPPPKPPPKPPLSTAIPPLQKKKSFD
jgi:hypothetical protein